MTIISWRFHISVLLLSTTLAATLWTARDKPEQLAQPLASIDTRIDGWELNASPALSAKVLQRLHPTETLNRIYRRRDQQLSLFVAYYAQQRAGESMHSPKHCLPGSGWEIWNPGSVDIELNGESVRVNRYGIQNAGTRQVMLYWYQSAERVIGSEYLAKF